MNLHIKKIGLILIPRHKKMYVIRIPLLNEYPTLDEEDFASQLTRFKDFNIKGKVYKADTPQELIDLSDRLCNQELTLSTHQTVIRNFLSNETPYNGLLLFHGLGSGKTCSAITIAEEHRTFLKESGLKRHIYVLGGLNIQDNFQKQFFHESNLIQEGKEWTYKGCVGNTLLREVSLMGSKQDIVNRVQEVIQTHYIFMGYRKFANYIHKKRKELSELEHSMIIIDEVHNIKEEGSGFTPSRALDLLTKKTNVKLLLLSATPMFNDPSEIIWITNLLNRNDKRYELHENDIFTKEGDFRENAKELFLHHIRGYVSYVKGENPFTFPYRIYPSYFYQHDMTPTKPFSQDTMEPLHTQVYPVKLSLHQTTIYNKALEVATSKTLSMGDSIPLLSVLNMTYPKGNLDYMSKNGDVYEYYPGKLRCFDTEHLETYSAKIYAICQHIQKSEGIVLVYSQLLEGGVIPLALALESIGFKNWNKPLLKGSSQTSPFKYGMLTGSPTLSPKSDECIRLLNSPENVNGQLMKVVLITKAASEGVDLKNIRQIHIMDPWWNLNRVEQTIGRGIRLCSHKMLPFEKRNAQIYLYCSYTGETETVDHYMYRFAEKKAKKIGVVSRLLKENAMDCIMNLPSEMNVLTVPQVLSTGERIQYKVEEMSLSVQCDFMDCTYTCKCEEKQPILEPTLYNSSHTIERIRNQFKHGYVYEIKELHRDLNLFLPLSLDHLEEVLTEMVQLKIECWDMFHRSGYLVNYGTYYFFQPTSIPENAPVYERRIPSYKASYSIMFEPKEKHVHIKASELIDQMKKKLDESKKNNIFTEFGNLYHVRARLAVLATRHGFVYHDDVFDACVIESMVERFNYKECVAMIQSLQPDDFSTSIMNYFKPFAIPDGTLLHVWNQASIVTLFLQTGDTQWKEYAYHYEPTQLPKVVFGTVVGGITNKGDEEERVFKSKDMDDKVSYGQICKNAGLTSHVIPRIKKVLGDTDYTSSRDKICSELEFLLRYLDKIKYQGKRWFLNAIEVIENKNDTIINLIKKNK